MKPREVLCLGFVVATCLAALLIEARREGIVPPFVDTSMFYTRTSAP